MTPLKICDLSQFYSPVSGGVKRYLHEKSRYIESQTEDRHVIILPGERDERHEQGRVVVHTIASPRLSRTTGYRALLRLGAVERILEAEQPDLLEAADPYQLGWKALASGQALGIPVVGFYHSHFPEAYLRTVAPYVGEAATELLLDGARRYVRHLYNRFERTLVPSPGLGAVLAGWGVGNLSDVDLGVDTALYRPGADAAETRAELGIPPGRALLLYVGRLAQEKNTRTLFDAFARLHHEEPQRWHLLVVGDGLQRPFLETVRAETGAVTWLPYCGDGTRLAALYRAADLFVHPGVQETFGLVSLEAQACGTPVIGIRGSYMDRIIHTPQERWAAENSAPALAEAIRCEAGAAPDGKAASAAVHARYGWNAVFARLFGVYRDTIERYKHRNE